MEISDEWVSPVTMCAFVVSWGSHGMSRLHSCVELIVSTFGRVMRTGCRPHICDWCIFHHKMASCGRVTDGKLSAHVYGHGNSLVGSMGQGVDGTVKSCHAVVPLCTGIGTLCTDIGRIHCDFIVICYPNVYSIGYWGLSERGGDRLVVK